MHYIAYYWILFFAILVLMTPFAAKAQDAEEEDEIEEEEEDTPDPDRLEPLILPIIGGSTDIGALLGATGSIAKLGKGHDPYQWKGGFIAATSIKDGPDTVEFPVNYYALSFDIPGLAGGGLRLFPRGQFIRVVNAGYFGFGNASTITDPPENSSNVTAFRRNQYKKLITKVRLNAWITLPHDFYVLTGASFRYVIPEAYENSKLQEDARSEDSKGAPIIQGTSDHFLVGITLGIVYDSRDHEANPKKGMFHELSFRASPGPVTGTDFPYGASSLHLRFFFPLINEYLVLGLRLRSRFYFGTIPFHDLQLGNIRGVPRGRYHGRIRILGNVEFRSIFYRFSFLKHNFGLGAAAFFDSGRVFADYQYNPELDGIGLGLKYGVGGGIRFTWGETRVARFDIAYSPDKAALTPDQPVGIYLHIGHFF